MPRKTPSLRMGFAITHIAAFAVGCVLFRGVIAEHGGTTGEAAAEPAWKRSPRTTGPDSAGSALLHEMTRGLPLDPDPTRQSAEELSRLRDETAAGENSAADALPPAANVRAAAIALLSSGKQEYTPEEYSELTSRLLHWMRADPQGMIQHIYSKADPEHAESRRYHFRLIVDAAIARAGTATALEWMAVTPRSGSDIAGILGPRLAAGGDIAQLEAFKKHAGSAWQDVRFQILRAWPLEKADDLMRLAAPDQEGPGWLLNYAALHKEGGAEWIIAKLASGQLDEATRDELGKNGQYEAILSTATHLPPELRIQEILRHRPDLDATEARRRVVANDVMDALNSGRDVRYPFRHGQLTAWDIYQDIATRLPALAAQSPDALRRQVYQELAEEDPQAALTLLEDLPAAARQEAIVRAPLDMFGDVDPQRFYDFLQHIPASGEDTSSSSGGGAWDTRLQAWEGRSARNYDRLGGDYLAWVRQLPPGTDREMALYGLALNQTGMIEDATIRQLSAEIHDPRLLQRLAEKETEAAREEGK